MANFQTHITTSSLLGVVVAGAGSWYFQYDWATVLLAGGLTAIGGMLPDLDSDSGRPVRELFGLAGVFGPLLLTARLRRLGLTPEQLLVLFAAGYLTVRYGLSALFKRITVHRGMYHSVPAMLIAGLAVFLLHCPDHLVGGDELRKRLYFAVGTMIGFLSHLVLDEIYAVDLRGLIPKLNHFAGSALKFRSDSWVATGLTYAILCTMSYLAWFSMGGAPNWEPTWQQTISPKQNERASQK